MPEDTQFTLPGVDDPASTEAGVILLGLDAERLLAGLALADGADDPGLVALGVDQARHGTRPGVAFDDLVVAGLHRWRGFLAGGPVAALTVTSGSVREAWRHALTAVTAMSTDDAGPATRAYRAACWLRRDDVDRSAPGHSSAGSH